MTSENKNHSGDNIIELRDEDITNVTGGAGGLNYQQLAAAEGRFYLVSYDWNWGLGVPGGPVGCTGSPDCCENGKGEPFQGSIYAKYKINGNYADAKCYNCGKYFAMGADEPADPYNNGINDELAFF